MGLGFGMLCSMHNQLNDKLIGLFLLAGLTISFFKKEIVTVEMSYIRLKMTVLD